MKKVIRIVALLLTFCLLAGCGASTKTYTHGDVSMTVPSYMRDVSGQSAFTDFTFALDSSKIAVFGLNETFADYPVLKDYSTKDYADLVISSYQLNSVATQRSNYHYFVYTADTTEGEFTYVAGVFKNDKGFWMIQVCSLTTNYNQETFLSYLDSVKVG